MIQCCKCGRCYNKTGRLRKGQQMIGDVLSYGCIECDGKEVHGSYDFRKLKEVKIKEEED